MGFNLSCKINKKIYKQPLQLRVFTSDILTYIQIFVLKEYDFAVNKMPNVIVDAGANIGLASIYFANKFPNAKIIAIEPEKSNFAILKENVAHYPNIVPLQAALWHENKEIHLIDPGFGKWGFMTESKNISLKAKNKTCHAIMGITVDKLIQDYELEKIDILKIDIEGAEKEVFTNTSAWIGKVEALIVELHDYMKSGCKRSFYAGTHGFDNEWKQGENIYLVRGDCLQKHSKKI